VYVEIFCHPCALYLFGPYTPFTFYWCFLTSSLVHRGISTARQRSWRPREEAELLWPLLLLEAGADTDAASNVSGISIHSSHESFIFVAQEYILIALTLVRKKKLWPSTMNLKLYISMYSLLVFLTLQSSFFCWYPFCPQQHSRTIHISTALQHSVRLRATVTPQLLSFFKRVPIGKPKGGRFAPLSKCLDVESLCVPNGRVVKISKVTSSECLKFHCFFCDCQLAPCKLRPIWSVLSYNQIKIQVYSGIEGVISYKEISWTLLCIIKAKGRNKVASDKSKYLYPNSGLYCDIYQQMRSMENALRNVSAVYITWT